MAAAVAAGHAGLCGRLRLHRFFAVQRAVAGGFARRAGLARSPVAGCAQCLGGGAGVHPVALPLCVFAGPNRFGGKGCGPDGGSPTAGRTAFPPHSRNRLATGPPGCCRWRGFGADGNTGRLWCVQLFRHPDLHGGHLQSLAVHGQPHRCGATRHGFTGRGGGVAAAGAACAKAPALQSKPWFAPGLCRGAARIAAWCSPRHGMGGVQLARAAGFCVARAHHVAGFGRRDHRAALGALWAMGLHQLAPRGGDRFAGCGCGAGAGLQRAHPG